MSEKIDVLDVVIEVLKEHERDLDEKLNRLDELISDLCETLIKLQKVSLSMLQLNLLTAGKRPPEEIPQWVRDLLDLSVVEKALARLRGRDLEEHL